MAKIDNEKMWASILKYKPTTEEKEILKKAWIGRQFPFCVVVVMRILIRGALREQGLAEKDGQIVPLNDLGIEYKKIEYKKVVDKAILGKDTVYPKFDADSALKSYENDTTGFTDFEKCFQGMCCDKNKQFTKECCVYLLELARKQIVSEIEGQYNIDSMVCKFKQSGKNFLDKRVADIYRQGIQDCLEAIKKQGI